MWALVARYATLRALLAHCAVAELLLSHLDVENAFLNEPVEEEIYLRPPAGYSRGDPHKVCRLRKALDGLKHAARAWYRMLNATLDQAGFQRARSRPLPERAGRRTGQNVFVLADDEDLLVAATKGLQAGNNTALLAFKARDIGAPKYFLGIHIQWEGATGSVKLGQHQYATTLLDRFDLESANPASLPLQLGGSLSRKASYSLPPADRHIRS